MKIRFQSIIAIAIGLFTTVNSMAQQHNISTKNVYPTTRKDNSVKDIFFGTTVYDPYRWLENDTSSETKDWVRAENKVTHSYLDQIPFRDKIRKRLKEVWNYESLSAPFKAGKYTYFYKNSGLQNQYVLYRQIENEEPEVFIDPNTFSDKGTTSMSGIQFTKDGTMAAYQISEGGSDWHKIIILDALTKKQLGDTLIDIKFSGIAWKGNEGFYYSSYDKPKEGSELSGKTNYHKLYFHQLGTPQSSDKLIFGGEERKRRYIGGGITENGNWLVITAANFTHGNELYLQDLSKVDAPIIPIVENIKNMYDVIDADDNYLYIRTDYKAPTCKIMAAPIDRPQQEHWKKFIPQKRNNPSNSSTCGGYIFNTYLKEGISKVVQFDRKGKKIRTINLPGIGTTYGFSGKRTDKELFFMFTSYTTPPTIYKLNIATGKTELYRKPTVQFKSEDYESKQVFYRSKDGTKIPMIITHKKGLKLDGKNPTVLYGYGGFGVNLTPAFSTANIFLLENGGVYAVANLRGGNEYGGKWYAAGIKTKKQNVFDDFYAAAEWLKENKYTSTEYLAISGGSNGGLLVGAIMTQHPNVCKVAFPAVGVLDMLRYHKFTAGAGWAYDYGTSEDSKKMFDYLQGYSPLHNLVAGTNYPATLVTTADHDDRVVPAHSFKFAATLQEKNSGDNPVLIRIETKAGHGAGMSTNQLIESVTDKWAFLFWNLGIKL